MTVRLVLPVPPAAREALVARLALAGFDAFEDTRDALVAYAPAEAITADARAAVDAAARAAGLADVPEPETLPDTNWNAAWEATIRPLAVGRFVVAPTWHPPGAEHDGLIPITVDPKMAFGTGYHPTTRLVLRLLDGRVPAGGRVLDVGTGTGVLAIAALKTGAAHAVGVDIDPWSVENAAENAALNGVADRLEVAEGSAEDVPADPPFGLVLANIVRSVLVPMLPDLAARTAPGGSLILAGLLARERSDVLAAAERVGLRLADEATEADDRADTWWAVAFERDAS